MVVRRFALVPDEDALRQWVSRAGPEKDAWEHETGRIAVEQGLVVLAGGAKVGFEFMAADVPCPQWQLREEDVPVRRRVTRKSRFDLPAVADQEEGGMREQIVPLKNTKFSRVSFCL